MDSLEQQLTQLGILNKRQLSSKLNIVEDGITKDPKKVGPVVPPKPVKDMPQVPQSSIVRKTCEPLYSKRLQIINSCQNESQGDLNLSCMPSSSAQKAKLSNPNKNLFYDNDYSQNETSVKNNENRIGKASLLLRKQPAYERQHHVYSNIKMTLDNPAILDQQLEALEHHKKQLEKKGLLTYVNKENVNGPKLSSASYVNGELAAAVRSSPSVKMMAAMIIENQKKQQNQEINSKSAKDNNIQLSNQSVQLNFNSTSNSSINNIVKDCKSDAVKHQIQKNINKRLPPQQDIVYSNIMHSSNKYNLLGDTNIYTNVQYNPEEPPPQLISDDRPSILSLISSETGGLDYYSQQPQNTISGNEEEFPLPPSPVSSSYSELRRATDNFPQLPTYATTGYQSDLDSNKQNSYANTTYIDYSTFGEPSTQSFSQSSSASDYYGFGSTCQCSSTYESIYEPITINPTNQMTSRSNFSLYTSYENDGQGGNNSTTRNMIDNISLSSANNINSSNKEIEVQKFTDLIVNSMDSGNDTDSYGSCVKCGERVLGENSGCTAMDQIYHISCFTCTQCQINLQGKPFYSLENKPYCEEDYLNTLEKCSVCMKPILERILRATGKPYHPQCFTCVVCGNSLDGIPFTVDATNQNYCIQDFHKKFAPRCCVCREPIMPDPGQEETVRVVALDRSFHFECYKCEDCGLLLSSEAEGRGCYPLDDHVLCKSCNAKRVQVLTNRMAAEL